MTQKRLIIVLLAQWMLIFGASAQSSRIVCDETCKIEYATPQPPTQQTSTTQPLSPNTATPVATAPSETGYAVVSPIGHSTVPMIQQAPRLTTLEGKTIALVGGSFMATITHPELKRLIEQHYPTARVLLFDEVGAAGVYPAPGVVRRSKEEFQEALRRKKVDAVISGNCGCGLCTPKEVGSCIAAEYLGIPSVATMQEGMTAYLITGDESRNKVQTMPGGGFETVRIELPKAWDRLMAEAGYRPLSEFEIH